jgi:outer membrane receptor protein involved in Fe transport
MAITNFCSGNEISLPGYATFDVHVGVGWDRWSVELYGKNLNDAKGIEAFGPGGSAASIVPPSATPADTASIIQPRIFGIVLRGKL